jgi:iron complex outermembrane receptor protein
VQVIDNIGESRLWGIEADLQWVVSQGLTLLAGVGYLDAEYKETQEQITGVSLDTELAKAPQWSATASLDYRRDLAGGEGLFRVDYSYVDESYADVRNTPQLRQEAHNLVNARIAWTTADRDWTIAAYGRNIFDERYIINGFDVRAATGSVIAIPNEPRELGIQVIARF